MFCYVGLPVEEDFDYVWMEESEEEEIKEAPLRQSGRPRRANTTALPLCRCQDDPIVEVLTEAWSHGWSHWGSRS